MAALTQDRNTAARTMDHSVYDVAASKEIFKGALMVLDTSGNAEPGTAATGKVAVGRAVEYVDNSSGIAAAETVRVEHGTFKWANSGSNTITKAHIGDMAYIEDDQTVGNLATGMSAAGPIMQVDTDGVWVKTMPPEVLVSGLTAANNLSDVGTAATAATNLGLGTGDDVRHASMQLGATTAPIRKWVRKSLSAADIQTLNATPVQLVAAAAGKIAIPVAAIYSYTHVSTAYDGVGAGEDFRIQWQTGTVQAMPDLDTTSDINFGGTASDVAVIHADNAVKQKPVTNDDLEVTILTGEIYAAAGDGTLVIELLYDEYTV